MCVAACGVGGCGCGCGCGCVVEHVPGGPLAPVQRKQQGGEREVRFQGARGTD